MWERQIPYHLDLATVRAHLGAIAPKRLILTHMSEDVLARLDQLDCEAAEDGLTLQI